LLDALKEELFSAISLLNGEACHQFGRKNVSLLDRTNSLIIAQPINGHIADADSLLVTDLSGNVIEGNGEPMTDLAAHIELYRAFPQISSVAHTHSMYASAWAQAGRDIPVYGTFHMEHFKEAIPCSRDVTPREADNDYGMAAGLAMCETVEKRSLDPEAVPGMLLFQHGVFTWGGSATESVSRAIALEQIAMMAYLTEKINPDVIGTKRNIPEIDF